MNATHTNALPTTQAAVVVSGAIVTSVISQPQIPAHYKLLAASVLFDGTLGGLALDLYGTHDEDGYEVCAVAPAGTRLDLDAVLGPKVCDDMTGWCERHLPSNAELRAASNADARIGRHQWDRDFRVAA